jgi:AraC-like DNA-binding protein
MYTHVLTPADGHMQVVRRLDLLQPGGDTGRTHILTCRCKPSTPGPVDARLCIKWLERGAEAHQLNQRSLTLDEDSYLILNAQTRHTSIYRGDTEVHAWAVFFADELVRQTMADELADRGPCDAPDPRSFRFHDHLRPHGDTVSLLLRRIATRLATHAEADLWLEEQVVALLGAALRSEHLLQHSALAIASVKPATRQELLRRVCLAADYVCSNYEQPLTLDDIAASASLSRFHLVRLFRQVHGMTPHAYLQGKRLAVAQRLLLQTRLDLNEIAERAGFGSRWSLFRQLRKRSGAGGVALRHGIAPVPAKHLNDMTAAHAAPTPCPT